MSERWPRGPGGRNEESSALRDDSWSGSEATKRATRIVVVAARGGRPGWLLHVVLTHRDRPPGDETSRGAWDRFLAAWDRMVTGKKGAWWRATVYGGVGCLETTGGATGMTWHPHMHMMIELPEGVSVERFRDELAAKWASCTALAGAGVGVAGWDRAAGRDRDGRDAWCSVVAAPMPADVSLSVDGLADVRSAAYQTAKYPTPIADLADPARIAEFLSWAHGRQMTRWLGRWKDGDVQEWIAATVEFEAEEQRLKDVANGDRPDVGRRLPGFRPEGLAAMASAEAGGFMTFTAPSTGMCRYRLLAEVRGLQGWERMAGMQARLLPILTELSSADDLDEWVAAFRSLRKAPDIPSALDRWAQLRRAQSLEHWTEDAINAWYAERARGERDPGRGVAGVRG